MANQPKNKRKIHKSKSKNYPIGSKLKILEYAENHDSLAKNYEK